MEKLNRKLKALKDRRSILVTFSCRNNILLVFLYFKCVVFTSDVTASQPMAFAVLQSVMEMSTKYCDQPCRKSKIVNDSIECCGQ